MKQFMLATVLVLSLGLGVRSALAAEPAAATGGSATNAIVKLRALIVADRFPGMKRQSELFADVMPHLGVQLAWLSAYCHFAAIYRIPPPVGVPPPDSADQAAKDGYAQQAILRQIARETVSEYPYAGIKDVPLPQGVAKPVAVATTTPAAPASAVPAELKGWQSTADLPDGVRQAEQAPPRIETGTGPVAGGGGSIPCSEVSRGLKGVSHE